MEKGPSENTKYWTSPENEVEHFKHAKEFGFEDYPYKYSRKAVMFAQNSNSDLYIFKGEDGCINKYNEITKEYIKINSDGKIITYYKTSLRYFEKEMQKQNGEILQWIN